MLFVDLFCGCGGAGLGLLRAGLKPHRAVDINVDAATSYRLMTGHAATVADLSTTPVADIVGRFSGLFWLSSPCQSFSKMQRLANNPEDVLVKLFLNVLKQVLDYPKAWIVIENVPDIVSYPAFEEASSLILQHRGFDFYPERMKQYVLSSELYGVPQRRQRLYWIIPPRGIPVPPPPVPKKVAVKTFRDAIGDGFVDHDPELGQLTKTEIAFVKARLKNGYCPMNEWDSVPKTILASKQVRLHSGLFNHPEEDRGLTIGECMSIQGLPPIMLSGGKHSRRRQVGNAVPPAMSEEIGRLILHLT